MIASGRLDLVGIREKVFMILISTISKNLDCLGCIGAEFFAKKTWERGSPGFGALFADEAPFHFNRRSRRFAQIKNPALIAITRFV